ncbi:MAG: hypothetical protein R3336_06930, partial [Phycisphaeraceae bacterium]|nr:hypothetical protein [Phycisphaeraceae bacterium]
TTDDSSESRTTYRNTGSSEATTFAPGTLVRHPYFGLGRVESLSAAGPHTRAKVKFNSAGRKNLILQYARLERVKE